MALDNGNYEVFLNTVFFFFQLSALLENICLGEIYLQSVPSFSSYNTVQTGSGEMAQQLRRPAALAGDTHGHSSELPGTAAGCLRQ